MAWREGGAYIKLQRVRAAAHKVVQCGCAFIVWRIYVNALVLTQGSQHLEVLLHSGHMERRKACGEVHGTSRVSGVDSAGLQKEVAGLAQAGIGILACCEVQRC